MTPQATLLVLGKPVTFTPPRVHACKPPDVAIPHPGPCRGWKGKRQTPSLAPSPGSMGPRKKNTAKAKAVPKATAPAAAEPVPAAVAKLPRTARKENAQTAAQNTNPYNNLTATMNSPTYPAQGKAGEQWTPKLGPLPSGAFEENCTNVIAAFDMRMRGYNVQAAPIKNITKYGYAGGRTYQEMDQFLTDAYTLPDGKPHGRSFFRGEPRPPWQSFKQIDKEIEDNWPEGGRGAITTGKHIFSVIKSGGKARYIEAQSDETATRNVTRLYKTRFKGGNFGGEEPQEGKLIRLDDLVPADGILAAVATAGQNAAYAAQMTAAGIEDPRERFKGMRRR